MNYFKPLLLVLITGLFACQSQMEFDKYKWQTREDPAFPPSSREPMAKGLIKSKRLERLSQTEVESLLGQPDFSEGNTISYIIAEDYGYDIDPVSSKYLTVRFGSSSAVDSVYIEKSK